MRALQVIIFCHTEVGTVRGHDVLYDRRCEGEVSPAVSGIVEFADRYDIPIIFALTPQTMAVLDVDLSGHPQGLHLHPDDAVLRSKVGNEVESGVDCLGHYPFDSQQRLIHAGVEAFTGFAGRAPSIFVAGNWSENSDTLRVLEQTGFRYDGSCLPGLKNRCADWSRVPRLAQPFHPSLEDYQTKGSASITCLPVYQGLWGHHLTPELLHVVGVSYFKGALKEASVGGARVVHIYFHSPIGRAPAVLNEFGRVVEYAQDVLKAEFVRPESLPGDREETARPFPPAYIANLGVPILKSLLARRLPAHAGFGRTS